VSIFKRVLSRILPAGLACAIVVTRLYAQAPGEFKIEEASISDIQGAIRSGQTTCKQVVQSYLERAKAYNGACTALVTMDGAPIPASSGMVRAGSRLQYPTKTVAASTIFPDLDQYKGLPLDLGKMITSGFRPDSAAAIRMARRYSGSRPAECTGDSEHPWGAFDHLQGRL
jgi:hypothetical protein